MLPKIHLQLDGVDIGLESTSETRRIFNFNTKATPNPTLLSQWILRTYSASEIKQLTKFIQA